MQVLAGDIGGTKTLLQLAEVTKEHCHALHEARFESSAWSGLQPMVERFLQTSPHNAIPEVACFAVAGPVDGQRATVTNLPWDDLDVPQLVAHLGIHRVFFLNDFQAVGYGLDALSEDDIIVLQEGRERPHAPRALIGAGTGLGQSILLWQNGQYEPLDTEGGHVDFAPTDEEQIELLRFMRTRHDHISVERLLSGAGLVTIDQFLRNAEPRPAAVISEAALQGNDPIAEHALQLLVRIYVQQAGNLALTCLARGGVYVAGGIAPRILPFLQEGTFLQGFLAKGRMERILLNIPVRVVRNPRVGLLGAIRKARQYLLC